METLVVPQNTAIVEESLNRHGYRYRYVMAELKEKSLNRTDIDLDTDMLWLI